MAAQTVLFDLGNTALKIGVAERAFLKIITLPSATLSLDLLKTQLKELNELFFQRTNPALCLACSVVPRLNQVLSQACRETFGLKPLFVPTKLAIPLKVNYTPETSLGADRLVEAYAARQILNNETLIVLDLGTAITIDYVKGQSFEGGFIIPGPTAALKSLSLATAKLPSLELPSERLTFSLGRSTKTCMESGVIFGLVALLEGLISKLKTLSPNKAQVIATGGLAKSLSSYTPIFDRLEPNLVLEGLRFLALDIQNKEKD
ncbi:MAG: type III pantothenate kinase [Desulfovibrio sp.]|nr:type III pantothenate kinase [Desulfovibrio sp.]